MELDKRLGLRLMSLWLLCSSCVARFVVEKNSLTVTSPESIKGTHDSAIGNFGIPQYGGSMAGTVVYPKENKKGCKEYSDFGISFQSKPGALPTFVLVDRGVSGPGRCKINNGGCWHESRNGHAFSACSDNDDGKCKCPEGFKGDGIKSCEDINECKEKKACQCSDCSCKNTWGSYDCSCSGDLLYIRDHDTCISKSASEVKSAWTAFWIILIGLAMAAGGAYLVYKYRIRSYMDSEIRAIMAQYMPLDSQSEVPNHVHNEERA